MRNQIISSFYASEVKKVSSTKRMLKKVYENCSKRPILRKVRVLKDSGGKDNSRGVRRSRTWQLLSRFSESRRENVFALLCLTFPFMEKVINNLYILYQKLSLSPNSVFLCSKL